MILLKCCKVFVSFGTSISVKLPEISDFADFIHFHIVNKKSVTMIINLSERDVEIATLRVLGAPINRLGWMMFGEHLAIGLIGGILGFLFTLVGTQAMISSVVQWSFFMTVSADPVVAMELIGIVVFISVILTPYGMWRIRKMDLVEKVKDLSQ